MIISTDISKKDMVIVISKSQVAKMVYQLRPKTFFNSTFPAECLKEVDEDVDGFVLLDSDFQLTLEQLNEGLATDYASLNDFFDTMAANEYLIIQ